VSDEAERRDGLLRNAGRSGGILGTARRRAGSSMKACPQCHVRYPTGAVHCFLDGGELATIDDPLIGKTLAGRYVIEDLLGEGGMSTVYRATHKLVDRPCAVKVMSPGLATDAKVRERFRREAKSTQAIAHPNVIEIFDQGEMEDGIPYIVMELLDGATLSTLVDAGPIAPLRSLPLMIQIARGIARAHDLGVVHRDLKPDNIFVSRRADASDLVKILDFGIARSRTDTRLTNAGELFGTPQYMAPERIMTGEAGPSVDLYALGVIFFEIVTARLPFTAPDPATFLIRHLKEPAPAAKSVDPRIPDALDALISQLLEKDPSARPVDAHRVELDLVAIARTLRAAVPPEPEADPSSSRPPARTLPDAVIGQWSQRLHLFEQMAARAYGANIPDGQTRTLEELRRLVREIAENRAANAKEQAALEEIDARGRDARQRLGFAVDALGLDASKARDELRTALADLEEPEEATRRAMQAYAEAHREVVTWEGRSGQREPYEQLAVAYRQCASVVDDWLIERRRERDARSVVESKERGVADLEYQIAELRAALAKHEQAIDRDRDAAQARAVELNARQERLEPRALQLATTFCAPLRARPELGALFHRLEAFASSEGSR
jgi:serine/threonine protein kinase